MFEVYKYRINNFDNIFENNFERGSYDLRMSETDVLIPQSGEVQLAKPAPYSTHENVEFTDADPGNEYMLDDYVDVTRTLQDSDDAALGDFFSRPLKIGSFQWSSSTTLSEDLNPWNMYFTNPRVVNRISNYKLLRANLKVKIMINGTQFHYGRLLAAYEPLASFNQGAPIAGLVRQDLVRASQLPHIFLDPTSSTGGQLDLPFFYHKNYVEISASLWNELGTLYIRELNALKHANGAVDPITVSVFAWAENVSLSVLTSTEPNTLVPQAGETKKKNPTKTTQGKSKKKTKTTPGMSAPKPTGANKETHEANTSGVVSGPATAVAKVAGALKVVPWLTPFATATEMAANTTASIAKIFGYSRPTVTVDPEPFKPHAISSLATTTTPDGCDKLTVDNQQELALDTRIAGAGAEDPLSIKSIASRESYLTTFVWERQDAPETLLWNCRVQPCVWEESGTGKQKAFHFPACAVAALPFEYWTGSMTFRFQIVKSNFHKGRIKLVYDPNYMKSNEYNTNYLHIIDITEKTDFSVTIGNGQEYTLLERKSPRTDSKTECYSTTAYTSRDKGNGVLGVYVVNEMAVPNTDINNDIEINVFVKMEDDFEVFVPVDEFSTFTYGMPPSPTVRNEDNPWLDPQAGEISPAEESPTEVPPAAFSADAQDNEPIQEESCGLGPSTQDNDELVNKVFTGEAIESLRPLLKRYNLWNAVGPLDSFDTVISGRLAMFPYYRGYVPGAVYTDDNSGQPYNFCNTTLMHYVTQCFAGWRGSTRWKILPRGTMDYSQIYVQRTPEERNDGSGVYYLNVVAPETPNNRSNRSRNIVRTNVIDNQNPFPGMNGSSYRTSLINPVAEFEMPFYSRNRFFPGKRLNYTDSAPEIECFDFRIFTKGTLSTNFDMHVAAGDDFQVFMWTGMPRMYFELAPPIASD
jgi:hypothetical protein